MSRGAKWAVIIFLLGIVFMGFSCSREENYQKPIVSEERPDQESWNSTIIVTKDGLKKAVVTTEHLRRYSGKSIVYMDGKVEADFFNQQEKHISHLTALEAEINEKTNDMIARGNVIVVSDSGITLYTAELLWEHTTEKIRSDTTVTITTEKDTLHGVGLVSDTELKNWTILKPTGVTEREVRIRESAPEQKD